MKSGVSSLNPDAPPYIPLSIRELDDRTHASGKDSGTEIAHEFFQIHGKASHNPSAHDVEKLPATDVATLKSNRVHGFYGSSSQNVSEVKNIRMMDDEFDMEIEYLQMTFPGISDQFLSDVYMENNGDLEAAIDMLNQLELYTEDFESLPETLDIGDASQFVYSDDNASMEIQKVSGDASTSSSSTSGRLPSPDLFV